MCALVGAAANLVIAWRCLYWQQGPHVPRLLPPAQRYWDRYADRSEHHGPAKYHHLCGAVGCDFLIIDASPWSIGEAAPPRMMITTAGFPFRSFEGMHSWGPVTPPRAWAIPVDPHSPNVAWLSALPYRPRLTGLILNTALYGGMFWCAVFGPFALWRYINEDQRRRLHHCPQCDYDLRGNLEAGCPECGWGRS